MLTVLINYFADVCAQIVSCTCDITLFQWYHPLPDISGANFTLSLSIVVWHNLCQGSSIDPHYHIPGIGKVSKDLVDFLCTYFSKLIINGWKSFVVPKFERTNVRVATMREKTSLYQGICIKWLYIVEIQGIYAGHFIGRIFSDVQRTEMFLEALNQITISCINGIETQPDL